MTLSLQGRIPTDATAAAPPQQGVHVRGVAWLAWATAALSWLAILAHLPLLAGGRWDGDEFFFLFFLHRAGLPFFLSIQAFRPEPVSDIALYLYAQAVYLFHAPLVTPFLALIWALLIGACVAAAWHGAATGRLFRIAIGSTVAAMFLLGHQINEMLFWPAGAAYPISLAAITAATLLTINGCTASRGGRLAVGLALAVAALSAATGLFFAAGFGGVMLLLELPALWRGGRRGILRAAWYLVPFGLTLAIAGFIIRFGTAFKLTMAAPGNPYYHRPAASLIAMLHSLPGELLLHDGSRQGMSHTGSVLVQILLLAGFFGIASTGCFGKLPWRYRVALALAPVGVIVLTVFTSYYQYGAWGFERHHTFCQCMVVLLLLVLGWSAAQWRPLPVRLGRRVGWPCLLLAVALGLSVRLPAIIHDYRLLPAIREARDATWDSGMARDSGAMRFVLPPKGLVLEGMVWTPGHFTAQPQRPDTPWYVPDVLRFFGKQSVDIVPSPATQPAG